MSRIASARLPRLASFVGALLCVLSVQGGPALAKPYPERTIHLIVGFPPGGANDLTARQLAPRLGAALGGASVIVENRPGADGIIGTGSVARARPDGYTLGLTSMSALAVSPFTYRDIPYNSMTDFAGVSTLASSPLIFAVKPSLPVNSFKDLIAYAKAHPGKLNFAIVGAGGSTRVMLELFKLTTGVNVQSVTYKGAAQALTDLMGGRLDAMAIDFPVLYPLVKQGKLRALAMTGAKRSPLLPSVATMNELGYPQLTQGNWYALVAPAKTPPDVLIRLNAAMVKVAASPDMQKALMNGGLEPMTQPSPQAFSVFLKGQLDRWSKVVKAAGIRPQ